MFDAGLWFAGLAALAVFALAGWAVSVPLRNVSIVDGLWSLMFVLAAATYALVREEALGPRAALVLVLVSAWAIRLVGVHHLAQSRPRRGFPLPEDPHSQ